MRAFVGLVPPQEVQEDLSDFLASRREAGRDLRWTDPEQLHLTLAFLPNVPEAGLDRLSEALAARCARIEPAAIRLLGGGAFPNPYAARILHVGAEPTDWLKGVARGMRQAATHAGAVVDGGRFNPHVTVARMRRPIEATRWIRALMPYESPGWIADEFALIRSQLGQGRQGRPRYTRLATFALAGGRAEAGQSGSVTI